jgi:3-hydroxyacyl-[acyl-carrier-protein] dehydratase
LGQYDSFVLGYAQILEILPQGHPMVLVDRVTCLVVGERIVATKAITASEPCFAGIAPGRVVASAYPTALLLESLGQTAAILWLQSMRVARSLPGLLMLTVIRDCVIEGRAYPGDLVRHCARIENVVGENVLVSGESWIGNRRIMRAGSMVAVIRGAVGLASAGEDR